MGNTFYFQWEVSLMAWIQTWIGPVLTSVMSFFSAFGEDLIIIAVLAAVYFIYNKEIGKKVLVFNMVNLLVNPMIKNVVLRRRPYFDHESIDCLKPVDKDADIYDIAAQGYSFPSGHSSTASSSYIGLAYYIRKHAVTVIAVVLTLLVGISRFFLGVHYPTDVLAGWALGLVIVFGIGALDRKLKKTWILYAAILLLALPGWFYCETSDFYTGYGMTFGSVLAILFEERYVHFKVTRRPVRAVVRIAAALALFVALNTVLKLPFSSEVLEGSGLLAHVIRAARYAVCVFVVVGLYPLLFRFWDKKEQEKAIAERGAAGE